MRFFKTTYVGKGSALEKALEVSQKEAEKVYKETTKNYEALYSADARMGFAIQQDNFRFPKKEDSK